MVKDNKMKKVEFIREELMNEAKGGIYPIEGEEFKDLMKLMKVARKINRRFEKENKDITRTSHDDRGVRAVTLDISPYYITTNYENEQDAVLLSLSVSLVVQVGDDKKKLKKYAGKIKKLIPGNLKKRASIDKIEKDSSGLSYNFVVSPEFSADSYKEMEKQYNRLKKLAKRDKFIEVGSLRKAKGGKFKK